MKFFKKKIEPQNELPKQEVIFFTLHNLMLGSFIDIVCDGKFQAIVKSGEPTLEEIITYWEALYLQYSDMIGTSEYDLAVDSEKQVISTKAKIDLVATAMKLLVQVYVKDLADKINTEFDFNIQYFEDEETYYKQFVRVEGRLKMWKVELDILLMKNPKSEEKTVSRISRETFDNIKIELSSFMGYPVREHETTVAEFAVMIKRLKRQNEVQENQLRMHKVA